MPPPFPIFSLTCTRRFVHTARKQQEEAYYTPHHIRKSKYILGWLIFAATIAIGVTYREQKNIMKDRVEFHKRIRNLQRKMDNESATEAERERWTVLERLGYVKRVEDGNINGIQISANDKEIKQKAKEILMMGKQDDSEEEIL